MTTDVNRYLEVTDEVSDALQKGGPVVALESTIIAHGMPYPQNVETALEAEQTVRQRGGIPATVAIIDGRLRVGLTQGEVERLGGLRDRVAKVSRRDLPFVVFSGGVGATTVSATLIVAAMAGIRVFATGGIGGVHRRGETTLDISADLQELTHTDLVVVCAGIKSILDTRATLEYLETHGVPVVGFGTDVVPGFYTSESPFPVDHRVDTPEEVAEIARVRSELGISEGIVVANPIPKEHAMDPATIDAAIEQAFADSETEDVTGYDTTPYLLARVAEITRGQSLKANAALYLNNARVAASIAVALARSPHAAQVKALRVDDPTGKTS